ncbi:MAG: DNA helicase I, partial [Cytophagales bacterium]|nr:DNA helicase I [Cytophagales bacterium]
YVRVEGVWERNTNRAEAERVAELVFELLRTQPGKEIGVVTFNFPQGQLVQDVLEARAAERQVPLPESLFVKNLENVQGDERDIIVFSVGYAPDPKGRLVMQFGSLNQAGGENRLNVAVTRAREAIYVVTSLMPDQLRTDDAQHEGPRLLRQYLRYALDVSEGNYVPAPAAVEGFTGAHRLDDRLVAATPGLVKELPFADLAVKKDGRYEGLVLTDDALYFASLSAKEAHAYLPFLLARKGWPYRRLYSREWWKGKRTIVDG